MTLALIFSCVLTPYEIAFAANSAGGDNESTLEHHIDTLFDVLFFTEAVITFFTAVVTDEWNIIDDRKQIAEHYLTRWFIVDILSCIPYGTLGKAVLSEQDVLKIQYIKLIKLFRISKIVKEQHKIFKYLESYLGIEENAYQRLVYFCFIFILSSHVVACLWLILSRTVATIPLPTWNDKYVGREFGRFAQYTVSLSWTLQTITTVGYGDIDLNNDYEKIISLIVMIGGVILFSVGSGGLIATFQAMEDASDYNENVEVLFEIYQ